MAALYAETVESSKKESAACKSVVRLSVLSGVCTIRLVRDSQFFNLERKAMMTVEAELNAPPKKNPNYDVQYTIYIKNARKDYSRDS